MKQLIQLVAGSLLFVTIHAQTPSNVTPIIERYIAAVGGASTLDTVTSRITRGTFENGRGLSAPFVTWIRRPDHVATAIGVAAIGAPEGSGRATDGRTGWDKNFVGTGLRDLNGAELADFLRMADPFRPAHLIEACTATRLDETTDPTTEIVRCERPGGSERWWFNRTSGLVDRADFSSAAGRTVTTEFADYRLADGILTPFRERIVVPGATVTYTATTIRYNEPVPDGIFARPAR